LLPTVTAGVERTPDRKQLRLTIQTGPRARSRRVEFSGNASESTDRLEAVIAEQGLTRALWTDAAGIAQTLTAFYKANGYLNAAVRVEPVTISGSLAIRPIVIDEKRAFRLGSVRLEGTHAVTADEALRVLGLKAGDRYTEARVESGQLALDTYYRARGYNHVGIDSQTSTPGDQAGVGAADEVAVTVRVDEGAQQRLREIVTDGLTRTRPALVARALRLEAGAPVDLAAWNDARRRLYETGAFRSVDIQREAIEPAVAVEGAGQEEPIRARVTVQEWPPLRVRYGVEVRDELAAAGDAARANAPEPETPGGRTFGWGVAGDLAARGLFGTAMSAGVSGRYTLGTRASRAYLTAPSFFGRRLTSTVFVERSREEIGAALLSTEPEFETLKTDFTFEQRLRLARKTAISYLYTFERNHTRELNPNPLDPLPFDLSVTIGKFAATVLFDARNDLSDPSRGWFHSSNVQYAPAALGSDLRFLKYFVQQNYYRSVGRITLATAGRLGLATAFDTTLTPDQRFFAGGGNSVRGYAEDVLGPIDASGGAAGGNALIVLNEEVRFPIVWVVRGVGFFDAGRAFDRVGDMSLRALATSAGLGLRVQTPFVLLRVDMGVPFDDAFGARRARWFFSVGQLF
jgi:outer membrane protein assembly factor BamA